MGGGSQPGEMGRGGRRSREVEGRDLVGCGPSDRDHDGPQAYVEPGTAGLRIRYGRLDGELHPWRGDTFRIEWVDPFVRAVLGPSLAWFHLDGAGRVSRLSYTGFPGEVLVAARWAEPLGAERPDP